MSTISVRRADESDFDQLPEIEVRSDSRFHDLEGFTQFTAHMDMSARDYRDLPQGSKVFVADRNGESVGFAFTYILGPYLFLGQLSVLPEEQGNGAGSALLQIVCDEAQENDLHAVALITFKDVPWNGPFYAKRGFEIVDKHQIPAELISVVDSSSEAEWAKFSPRVLMMKKV